MKEWGKKQEHKEGNLSAATAVLPRAISALLQPGTMGSSCAGCHTWLVTAAAAWRPGPCLPSLLHQCPLLRSCLQLLKGSICASPLLCLAKSSILHSWNRGSSSSGVLSMSILTRDSSWGNMFFLPMLAPAQLRSWWGAAGSRCRNRKPIWPRLLLFQWSPAPCKAVLYSPWLKHPLHPGLLGTAEMLHTVYPPWICPYINTGKEEFSSEFYQIFGLLLQDLDSFDDTSLFSPNRNYSVGRNRCYLRKMQVI